MTRPLASSKQALDRPRMGRAKRAAKFGLGTMARNLSDSGRQPRHLCTRRESWLDGELGFVCKSTRKNVMMARVRQSAEGGSVQKESRRWQAKKHELTGGIDCLQPDAAVSNRVRIGRVDTMTVIGLPWGMPMAVAVYEHTESTLCQTLSNCSKKLSTP